MSSECFHRRLAEMERAVRQSAVPSVGPLEMRRPRTELRRSDSMDSRTSSVFVSRFGA